MASVLSARSALERLGRRSRRRRRIGPRRSRTLPASRRKSRRTSGGNGTTAASIEAGNWRGRRRGRIARLRRRDRERSRPRRARRRSGSNIAGSASPRAAHPSPQREGRSRAAARLPRPTRPAQAGAPSRETRLRSSGLASSRARNGRKRPAPPARLEGAQILLAEKVMRVGLVVGDVGERAARQRPLGLDDGVTFQQWRHVSERSAAEDVDDERIRLRLCLSRFRAWPTRSPRPSSSTD